MPAWMAVRKQLGNGRAMIGAWVVVINGSRIISRPILPHNALSRRMGRGCRFEYAGGTSAKLICDFFCQPTVPVPVNTEYSRNGRRDPRSFASFNAALLPFTA